MVDALTRLRPPGRVAPNGSGFAPFPFSALLGQTFTVAGIAPVELVGIPFAHTVTAVQTASPVGIASTNTFGVPVLSATTAAQINVTGIAGIGLVGVPFGHVAASDALADSPTIALRPPGRLSPGGTGFVTAPTIQIGAVQTIHPFGIPPSGTYTTEAGDTFTNEAGAPYTVEQFPTIGLPVLTHQVGIPPSGIASTNLFGSPSVSSKGEINPAGIASTLVFGIVSVSGGGTVTIHPVGIRSTNRFGKIGNKTISLVGIASTNQFGIPKIARGAEWNVEEPFAHWEIGFPRGHWACGDPKHRTAPPGGYGLTPYGEEGYGE